MRAEFLSAELNIRENWKDLHEDEGVMLKYTGEGMVFNPLNAELNPICHLLALLAAHHIFHVSGLRVIYGLE